jgi:histidinol-phosphate/aromatic aminotransferase/cobyric acid decarboxylase-like protein
MPKVRLQPHSVAPIKVPTLFAEFNPDLSTYEKPFIDCAGCENIDAPDSVIDALSNAIKKHPELIWDHWQPQDKNLRSKIANLHNVAIEQVHITAGAIAGIDYTCRIFTKAGTRTGIRKPDWPGFDHYADFNENEKIYLENFEYPFEMGADKIGRFVKEKSIDFMIVANPVPVQGHLIPKEIDEADTVTPETQAAHLAAKYDNAIFLGSLSKFYGLSGLRIGYLITPLLYTKHFKNTIDVIEVSSLAILAGNIVMNDESYQKKTQENVLQSMKILQEACKGTTYQLSATPHCFGAYLYSETRNPWEDLKAEGIKILEGQYFGLPSSVNGGRFNLANPPNATLAAEKIKKIHS